MNLHVCVCVCERMCFFECQYVYAFLFAWCYGCAFVCVFVCMCVRTHTRACGCGRAHAHTHACVCVCVCTSKKVGRDLKSCFHFPSTTTTHPPPLEAISRGSVARFMRNRSPVETGRCNLTQTPCKRSTQEQLVPSWDQSLPGLRLPMPTSTSWTMSMCCTANHW